MTQINNATTLSIKDFFTPKMLKFAIIPFLVSIAILYTLFFVVATSSLDSLGTMDVHSTQTTIQNGIPHTESIQATLEGSAIIKFLMAHSLTAWIAKFFVYAIGGFLTLYLSIFTTLIIIGFLTPFILKELKQRHYQDVEMIGYSNIFGGVFLLIKYTAIMMLLFIVFIPLYFIPLINIVAFNFPLYYFFHKVMTYDVSSSICSEEEYYLIQGKFKTEIRMKTLALYLISLIPFAIFFASVFFVILLGNTYFLKTKELRIQN